MCDEDKLWTAARIENKTNWAFLVLPVGLSPNIRTPAPWTLTPLLSFPETWVWHIDMSYQSQIIHLSCKSAFLLSLKYLQCAPPRLRRWPRCPQLDSIRTCFFAGSFPPTLHVPAYTLVLQKPLQLPHLTCPLLPHYLIICALLLAHTSKTQFVVISFTYWFTCLSSVFTEWNASSMRSETLFQCLAICISSITIYWIIEWTQAFRNDSWLYTSVTKHFASCKWLFKNFIEV